MGGRPTIYSQELAEIICKRLADGESLRAVCRDADMPHNSTVLLWAITPDHPFSDQYARARQVQAENMAEEIFEIADDHEDDYIYDDDGKRVYNGEHVNRSRLKVDTRKWYMSKVLPKFRDRIDLGIEKKKVKRTVRRFDGEIDD
jgi:hypothetical protein